MPVSAAFEYEVWLVQDDRVTFVNGRWRGAGDPLLMTGAEIARALKSCPLLWDLLNEKGRDGWELISLMSFSTDGAEGVKAFLKRARTV